MGNIVSTLILKERHGKACLGESYGMKHRSQRIYMSFYGNMSSIEASEDSLGEPYTLAKWKLSPPQSPLCGSPPSLEERKMRHLATSSCNPSTWKAETRRWEVWVQPGTKGQVWGQHGVKLYIRIWSKEIKYSLGAPNCWHKICQWDSHRSTSYIRFPPWWITDEGVTPMRGD